MYQKHSGVTFSAASWRPTVPNLKYLPPWLTLVPPSRRQKASIAEHLRDFIYAIIRYERAGPAVGRLVVDTYQTLGSVADSTNIARKLTRQRF